VLPKRRTDVGYFDGPCILRQQHAAGISNIASYVGYKESRDWPDLLAEVVHAVSEGTARMVPVSGCDGQALERSGRSEVHF
jgi:hypothetical protein